MLTLLQSSYKKLKANVYLDKTQPILRDKIVRYETRSTDVDESLKELSLRFCSDDSWESYKNNLLSTIKALTFPKALVDSESNIVINRKVEEAVVKKPQYFFDSNIEIQILGVAWILTFGKLLDKKFSENVYGNRLRKYNNDCLDFSPYLFYPYFSNYEKWRDYGLECAKKLLEEDKDVLVFTMDVKDYFHSVDVNQAIFDRIYEDCSIENEGLREPYMIKLHNFIFEVMQKYSSYFRKDRTILPIGFLPSNIISNWYLEYLDRAVIDAWNPSYYGRYVDDILIVDKVEKEGAVHDILHSSKKDIEREVLEHFLYNPTWKTVNKILIEQDKCSFNKDLEQCVDCEKKQDTIYEINSRLWSSKFRNLKPELRIQNKKVGVYFFDKEGSKALITCFQKNIAKNTSMFKLLPEDEEAIEFDDYSGIYKLQYNDTINKLSGVKGISLDKYEFSKFLGRQFKIGTLIRDKLESRFLKDIKKVLDNPTIVDNYRFWESIFNYFVVNGYHNGLKAFIQDVLKAIHNINETQVADKVTANTIQESLYQFVVSVLNRSLSLVWGKNIDELLDSLDKEYSKEMWYDGFLHSRNLNQIKSGYCKTRMVNKYLIPGCLDSIVDNLPKLVLSLPRNINLSNFNDIILLYSVSKTDDAKELEDYKYYPYIVTPQEIIFDYCIKYVFYPNDEVKSPNINATCLRKTYFSKNFASAESESNQLPEIDSIFEDEKDIEAFKIGLDNKKEVRVAIANVPLDEKSLINVLRGWPDRSYKRYNRLSKVVNQAIKEKADMLILPEAYVPMEWIPALARISANSQMAIIFGVEHITNCNGRVFNYTASILPYSKEHEYNFTHIVFHQKKYFAPGESECIRGYRAKPECGKSSELIVWNDLWFTTLCCYELASIQDRSKLFNYIDMLIAIEWNKDVNYFSNIVESLSRDLHCYCVQVNSSRYGDNRITQPAATERKDLIRSRGGINESVFIDIVKVDALRHFQEMEYHLQKENDRFKPTPPRFDKNLVSKKIKGTLWEEIWKLGVKGKQ